MPTFHHGDVEIAYFDQGEGEPIVLVHGFASNKEVNWVNPSWVSTLTRAGRRGDRARQPRPRRSRASSTIRRPIIGRRSWPKTCARCSIISRSSARTSWAIPWARASRAFLAVNHPQRVRSAIIGGLGIKLVDGQIGVMPEASSRRCEAPSLADVSDPTGRAFRSFAEQTKSDLKALAACMAGPREKLTPRAGRRHHRAGLGCGRNQGRRCGFGRGAGRP